MKLPEIFELYNLISIGSENLPIRKQTRELRKATLNPVSLDNGFTKIAFDTRRIDQETEYNPRRGLQNYNRSEEFINEAMSQKIRNFAKLRNVLNNLKEIYGKEPEWQDSNARVLLSTLNKGLRSEANDSDFTESQPGTGSFDYIEELMHVRYRLGFDDLTKMGESELKRVILSKDEEITRKDANQSLQIKKSDVVGQSYDTLIDKLFNVKASEEHPDVERIVTISIRDVFKK